MKKKSIIAFLSLIFAIACVAGLTSCIDDGTHTHAFDSAWSTTDTHHWHACDGCDEQSDYAPHAFGEWTILTPATETTPGSRSRACSTCGYAQVQQIPELSHTHTYATTYTYDEREHWRAATCGHDVKIDRAAHAFRDGACSVCGCADPNAVYDFTEVRDDGELIGYAIAVKAECRSNTAFTIPEEYDGKPVVAIADYAFRETAMTTLTIPDCIQSIGNSAFWSSELKEIVIPDSVRTIGYAFYAAPKLEQVVLGNGIEEIPMYAFRATPSLTSVQLGNRVRSIGDYAFYQCGISRIKLPDSVQTLGKSVFHDATSLQSIVLSSQITSIPEYTFYNCSQLQAFSLANISQVGAKAFYNCGNFQADISTETTEFATDAFRQSGIASLYWDKPTVPRYGFTDLPRLTSVVLGDNVTKLDSFAFQNCAALKSISIGKSLSAYDGSAFAGCPYGTITVHPDNASLSVADNMLLSKDGTILKRANAAGDIPSTVTTIGGYAFYGHEAIETLTCENIRFIQDYAFAGCKKLKSVTLMPNPNKGAFAVQSHAFADCLQLQTVVVPAKVGHLGMSVFKGCTDLQSVRFEYTPNWKVLKNGESSSAGTLVDVSDPHKNVEYFIDLYADRSWYNGSAQNNS